MPINGTSLSDTITGTSANDVIYALDGNDTINAGAGNDVVYGGAGNDIYNDAAGDDVFDGGDGADSFLGSGGIDIFIGGAGDDRVTAAVLSDLNSLLASGDAGSDTIDLSVLTSGAVFDLNLPMLSISGSLGGQLTFSGFENLYGTRGNDTIIGTSGANILRGGPAVDTINGGGGDDIIAGGAANDTLDGGAGIDTVSFEDFTNPVNWVTLNLGTGAMTGAGGVDRLSNFENITGAAGNDTLTGDNNANVIDGWLGDDTLDGAGGVDTLSYALAAAPVTVSLAITTRQTTGGGGADLVRNFENILGSNFSDTLTGDAGANVISGGLGKDTLSGGEGNDSLLGGGGNDRLVGGAGDDVYDGGDAIDIADFRGSAGGVSVNLSTTNAQATGEGSDRFISIETLFGSRFADSFVGSDADNRISGEEGDDVIDGGAGVDTADYTSATSGVTVSLALDGVAQNTGGAGVDTLIRIEALSGSNFDDVFTGNDGANVMFGARGADRLNGAGGDDVIAGGAGDDTIEGGGGIDTVNGGAGADTYVLRTTSGALTIQDPDGFDTIDASALTQGVELRLAPGSTSTIGEQTVTIDNTRISALPLDVLFVQDLSGSFGDDLPNVLGAVPDIVASLRAAQADSQFGVVSFVDKPFGSFGGGSDYTYRLDLALTDDEGALAAVYAGLEILGGGDLPESQIEALLQIGLRAETEIGFRPNTTRIAIVLTDAEAHLAGDGLAEGIATPNNGDTSLDGTPPGAGEDYPSVVQVAQALQESGITPIFAVTSGQNAFYEDIVEQLGFGGVISLSSDSADIVDAVNSALDVVTTTKIERAVGTSFADRLIGSDDDNTLEGRGGDDRLDGGGGSDSLVGGIGADRLDGGDGRDYARYDNSAIGIVANLQFAWVNTGEAYGDGYIGVEGLVGSRFADVLAGDAGGNHLYGLSGDDRIHGLAGTDFLSGDAGDDHLHGGLGADQLDGGDGFDYAQYQDATAAVTANLVQAFLNTGEASGDSYVSIEGLVGSAYNDTLTGDAGVNRLFGGEGSDLLYGGEGDDQLDAGGGARNFLWGGLGADQLLGGQGFDFARYDAASTGVVVDFMFGGLNAGEATGDTIFSIEGLVGSLFDDLLAGDDVANQIFGLAGDDVIYGRFGDDYLAGDAGDDRIEGGAGADFIDGGEGFDLAFYEFASASVTVHMLYPHVNTGDAAGDGYRNVEGLAGSRHDDFLAGNDANNTIFGGAGADALYGLGGADALYGGGGADMFIFRLGDSVETVRDGILDFETGVDRIDFTQLRFNGADSIGIYAREDGFLQINHDRGGDGSVETSILVMGHVAMSDILV